MKTLTYIIITLSLLVSCQSDPVNNEFEKIDFPVIDYTINPTIDTTILDRKEQGFLLALKLLNFQMEL